MSTKPPPGGGFRETSWFSEGVRKSVLHEEAAATGEELPEDHRTLEEKYVEGAAAPGTDGAAAPADPSLSLHTGKTGMHQALPAGPKKQMFQRDTAGALAAVVRTPAARFFRGMGFTLGAIVLLVVAVTVASYTSPSFAAMLRGLFGR
jgi:hypothetical protein